MMIKKLGCEHAEALTTLTFISKVYWGYTKSQMDLWKKELTITVDSFSEYQFYGLIKENEIVGYYSYQIQKDHCYLDNLFIHPDYLHKGHGKLLVKDLHSRIQSLEKTHIYLYADPHAEGFYLKMGYQTVGQKTTAIKDRYLPIMTFYL